MNDSRHFSYIDYTSDVMLAMLIMKNICNIRSMQGNGKAELSEVPHYVTGDDFFSRLNPDELSNIHAKMIKALIRKRSFENARFLNKYWLVIVDAT